MMKVVYNESWKNRLKRCVFFIIAANMLLCTRFSCNAIGYLERLSSANDEKIFLL